MLPNISLFSVLFAKIHYQVTSFKRTISKEKRKTVTEQCLYLKCYIGKLSKQYKVLLTEILNHFLALITENHFFKSKAMNS